MHALENEVAGKFTSMRQTRQTNKHPSTTPTATTSPAKRSKRDDKPISKNNYSFNLDVNDCRGKHEGHTYYKTITCLSHDSNNNNDQPETKILKEEYFIKTTSHTEEIPILLIRTARNDATSFSLLTPPISKQDSDYSSIVLTSVTGIRVPEHENNEPSEKLWASLLVHKKAKEEQVRHEHQQRDQTVREVISARHTPTHQSSSHLEALLTANLEINKELLIAIKALTATIANNTQDNRLTINALQTTSTNMLEITKQFFGRPTATENKSEK